MKKFALTALAAATALAMGAPAMAQSYGERHDNGRWDSRHDGARWDYSHNWDRGFNINAMQRQLDVRIDRGVRDGRLNRAEARRMEAQFREIARIEANYRRGGLTRWERNDLERRLVAFETRLDRQLGDGQYAYGYRR